MSFDDPTSSPGHGSNWGRAENILLREAIYLSGEEVAVEVAVGKLAQVSLSCPAPVPAWESSPVVLVSEANPHTGGAHLGCPPCVSYPWRAPSVRPRTRCRWTTRPRAIEG